jgi:hypothetical protein
MTVEVKRRGRGRPPLVLDFKKTCGFAALGMRDDDIARNMKCSLRSLYRFWDSEPGRRDKIEQARTASLSTMLKALYEEACDGKVSAANLIIRRMKKG